ncbi:hypothetical protein HMPREF9156_01189 [Scardovia wiggsiae F0424]|uniref:Uncharacterized protein n=1 Tax=Scardovia wiggsiae F0424 TaxID=857290 RepID=J0WYM7_9BIFI|nr:hypothetical protein HMPREF9156_01189 [Scardovia wiggsiae F0424]
MLVVKHADTKYSSGVFHNFHFCICVFYHQQLRSHADCRVITNCVIQDARYTDNQ